MDERPSRDAPDSLAQALLEAGRVGFPVEVPGTTGPPTDRSGRPSVELEAGGPFKLSSSELYTRAHTALDASLRLWRDGLDPDARAHLRIAFDHLIVYAWVAADPDDTSRPVSIARDWYELRAKQIPKLACYEEGYSDQALSDLGYATIFAESKRMQELVPPLPSPEEMCAIVDAAWSERLRFEEDSVNSFSGWYSKISRSASAFVHPTPKGLSSVTRLADSTYVVDLPEQATARVPWIVFGLVFRLIGVALYATPWLVDEEEVSRVDEGLAPGVR